MTNDEKHVPAQDIQQKTPSLSRHARKNLQRNYLLRTVRFGIRTYQPERERELQEQGDVHDWEFLLAEIKKQIDYLEWIRKHLERHPEFFTTHFMNAFLKYMTI
jgi:hypothetical protein